MLRPPDFGNRFKLVLNTRMNRTMAGNLDSLKGNAPTWQGFFASYSALSLAQITEFRNWVFASFGRQVTFKDFEGRTWTGIITSPNIPIIGGRGECNYQVEFEFEGTVA